MDSQLSSSFHLAHVFLHPLLSHAFRLLPDLLPAPIHHGRRASAFAVQVVRLPHELATADGVAGARLRAQAKAWSRAAGQLGAKGFCLLLGVRPGRAGATSVVVLPHAAGVLRAPAAAPFPQFHHIGGDLRPPLRDVRGGAGQRPPLIGGYYFARRTQGHSRYIAPVSPGRWERWREDWVLMQADAHDRLVIPAAALTLNRAEWGKDPGLESGFDPVLDRI
jgi:hypothetical protein